MVTALYASIFTLLIVGLSLKVIRERYRNKVSMGDGGNKTLQSAIGAQTNAVEYLPIALILLYLLEVAGASPWLLHLFGAALMIGRAFHVKGMLSQRLKARVIGMHLTVYSLVGLSILNLLWFM
jgi:uncharacterized membrane protein YecN with MAPEG domain